MKVLMIFQLSSQKIKFKNLSNTLKFYLESAHDTCTQLKIEEP